MLATEIPFLYSLSGTVMQIERTPELMERLLRERVRGERVTLAPGQRGEAVVTTGSLN